MRGIRIDLGARSAVLTAVAVMATMLVVRLLMPAAMPLALVVAGFTVCAVLSQPILHWIRRKGRPSDPTIRRLRLDTRDPLDAVLLGSKHPRPMATSGDTQRGIMTAGAAMRPASAYLPLNTYLEHRYASNVVLTFEQIEALLGFSLPASARTEGEWWTNTVAHPDGQARAWAAAGRTATPNLGARTVSFIRRA